MPAFLDAPFLPLAHQGYSPDGLQNTMAAFEGARRLGFRYLETDAQATRDGVAVTMHDPTLDRMTDARGAIVDLTWRQVRSARVGGREPVPTLEEVLGSWPDMRVNIDVKAASAAAPVARAIERTRAHDRVLVASFSRARREATLRRLSRPVVSSASPAEVAGWVLGTRTAAPGVVRRALELVECAQVPVRTAQVTVVDRRTVAAIHRAGRAVHVWTVNDAREMARLIDLGVDGIVTDRADLLRDVLAARGRWN